MNTKDWEEQFDKIQSKCKYDDYTDERFCCGGDYCTGDHNGFIKSFIRELLAKQREELVEECIKAMPDKAKLATTKAEAIKVAGVYLSQETMQAAKDCLNSELEGWNNYRDEAITNLKALQRVSK